MSCHTAFRSCLIAALVFLPVSVAAQDAEDATGIESTLPVGQTPIGETYIAETHGDWEIRCIRAEEGQPEPCQMYQLLVDQGGSPVAELNVFDLPDEGQIVAGATVVTPLDTLLTPGMRMRVDAGPWAEYPFAFCQQVGSFVRPGLTAAALDPFRNGGVATVAIVPLPAPDQVVQIEASLIGFTAGFGALSERATIAQGLLGNQ